MVAVTEESRGSSPVTITTSYLENRPRTVVRMSWRMEKVIEEPAGSAVHLPAR